MVEESDRRMLSGPELRAVNDRMSLLVGEVARASAGLELGLRQLMQALLDSKYAEVTAAGLGANELMQTCTALLKINREVTEDERAECLSHLQALRPLFEQRNHLVHGLWAPHGSRVGDAEANGALALVSKRRTATRVVDISFESAGNLAESLRDCHMKILHWTADCLPTQLRREQVTKPLAE